MWIAVIGNLLGVGIIASAIFISAGRSIPEKVLIGMIALPSVLALTQIWTVCGDLLGAGIIASAIYISGGKSIPEKVLIGILAFPSVLVLAGIHVINTITL